jgi:hypothetical protein
MINCRSNGVVADLGLDRKEQENGGEDGEVKTGKQAAFLSAIRKDLARILFKQCSHLRLIHFPIRYHAARVLR